MAQILAPALLASQDADYRQPIAEIKLGQFQADIPFAGQRLDTITRAEGLPQLAAHSSGALCGVFVNGYGEAGQQLRFVWTDSDRLMFSAADVYSPGLNSFSIEAACLVEKPNADIVLYWAEHQINDTQIRQMTVGIDGAVKAAASVAVDFALNEKCTSVSVIYTGSDYLMAYVRKGSDGRSFLCTRRSGDGGVWGAEGVRALTGLDSQKPVDNCCLVKVSTDIMLWFDYDESYKLFNLYYLASTDNGVAWSSPAKVTAYSRPDAVGKRPFLFARTVGEIVAAYDEIRAALHITQTTSGWNTTKDMSPASMHFDAATRQLYVICSNLYAGTKNLYGVVKIDVDTWAITGFWNDKTVPAFSGFFTGDCVVPFFYNRMQGDSRYIPVMGQGAGFGIVSLLDGVNNSITNIIMGNNTTYGLSQNVTGLPDLGTYWYPDWCKVDAAAKRLYIGIVHSHAYGSRLAVGWVDIGAGAPYQWHGMLDETGAVSEVEMIDFQFGSGNIHLDAAAGVYMVSYAHKSDGSPANWTGRLRIYNLADNTLIKDYKPATHEMFPLRGLNTVTCLNGKIYGTFTYTAYSGNQDRRGVCVIDMATDSISFMQPPFQVDDDLQGSCILKTQDLKLLLVCRYGVAAWSVADGWLIYNNSNVSNLYPGTQTPYWAGPLAYDPTNQLVFFGYSDETNYTGVSAFGIGGALLKAKYFTGQRTGPGTYSFQEAAPLVTGNADYAATLCAEPGTMALYAMWVGKGRIKWDKEAGEFDAKDYLLRGEEINLKRNMDNRPEELSFSLASGHLFDPLNVQSLLSRYVRKGKKATLRFGERIGGVDYWQPGRHEFVITTIAMQSYARDQAPVMRITGEDRRTLFEHGAIVATPYYDLTPPDQAIGDLVKRFGGWTNELLNIAAFDNATAIQHQWVDKGLTEIINQIAHRYGYFLYIDPATNQLTVRKIIMNEADPDHLYTGSTWLENFSPDDTFSDFTNKITVTGESGTLIDVSYAEERVTSDAGTVGWWKRKKTRRIYYSQDKSRRCSNPRLEKVESSMSAPFMLAGKIKENIIYEDPEQKFCDVAIEAPDLTPVLLAAIALIVAGRSCPPVMTQTGPAQSKTGAMLSDTGNQLALQVLASVANYQFDIYATPVGKIRQTFEASSYDLELQSDLDGQTIERRIEEPLCHNIEECQKVADLEMSILKSQRRRVRLTKMAHLQDEPGDRIQLRHPYSQQPMTMLVVELTRKFKVPASANDAGYFRDEVEGWIL